MPSLNSRYANYALSHLYSLKVNTKYIKQNTGIQNLDVKAYLSEPITIPSIKKQEKVVDYLDTKTQTLDKILTAKNHTHTHTYQSSARRLLRMPCLGMEVQL